jgi:TonB family protein
MNTQAILALGLVLGLTRSVGAQSCDFKGLSTFKESDFVQLAVVRKVLPTYPEEARRLGLSGLVHVRILIDEKGRVARACADPKLSSISDTLFVEAAQSAAKQWRFKPYFGFSKVPKTLKGKYLEDALEFKFVPTGQEKTRECDKKGSANRR